MTTAAQKPFREIYPDGRIEVHLNVPQARLLASPAQIPILQSGTQVGKTCGLVEWLAQEMERCGPGDYMFVSPTFPLMELKAISELKERFVTLTGQFRHRPGYHRLESVEENERGVPEYRILLGSAVNPDSLESATVKAVAIDELAQSSFPRQAWEALVRRVSVNQGRICAGTTLYDVSSWYKTEIYDKWKDGDPRFDIIQADSVENPAFPREQYEQARRDLPSWKFNMFYRGVYERPTGLVYDAFDETTQVIPAFDLRLPQYQEWPRYVGHDFGPNNTAAVWLAQDPGTGFLYVYRDYHRGGLSVGQHVAEFKRLSAAETIRNRTGGAWAEEEARYAYTAAGWPIFKPAIRDVEAGIDRVYSFVAKNQLFVFNDCQRFINEIMSYTRELDENYETTDKIRDKARFHLMDSIRYCLSGFSPERADTRTEAYMKLHGAPRRARRRLAGARR